MARRVLGIPSPVVDIMGEIEEFFVFMRRYSQTPLEEYLSMENLIDIVLNVWDVLKYEVGADVGQRKSNSKNKYDKTKYLELQREICKGFQVIVDVNNI